MWMYDRGVGGLKKCFLEISHFEQQVGVSEYFPGRFMNYQFFEVSSSFVAHSDEKFGGGITVPPSCIQ